MNERTQIIIKLISSHLILIAGLIIISIFIRDDAYLSLSITQTVLCILFFAGYWEFFGLRFKRIFCALMESLITSLFLWRLFSGSNNRLNVYLVPVLLMIQVFLLYELIKIIIVINKKGNPSMDIEFPFKNGTYLITDGGNSKISRLMNYHYYSPVHKKNRTNNSMLYAADIIRIADKRSKFIPLMNEDYPVYNEKIFSPIDGIIVKVENNITDNKIFAGNYPYNTGNTVVIRKDDFYFLLGHLKKGSIMVKEGDLIKTNDLVGAIGNSGWTGRPHLHMQLIKSETGNYWSGTGVCIRCIKKNLYKNRLLKIKQIS